MNLHKLLNQPQKMVYDFRTKVHHMGTVRRSKSKSDRNKSRANRLCKYCIHYYSKDSETKIDESTQICKLNKKQMYNLTGWCRYYKNKASLKNKAGGVDGRQG